MERESMQFDVLIVGAGPAGLAAAIRLKQLANETQQDISVCILEKAAQIGGHILSGAVIDPRALNELIPDWQQLYTESDSSLLTPVSNDKFMVLSKNNAFSLPVPKQMQNHGNYIVSLGRLCAWLGEFAQQLGVDIYPGFSGQQLSYDEHGRVSGIITGQAGIDKQGQHNDRYTPGMILQAKQYILAEGCRGSLSKQVIAKFQLAQNSEAQTYGIGIKELWQVDNDQYQAGTVIHTVGWPLDNKTYGGSFIYHLSEQRIAVGFVIGLDYKNPHLDPFKEMQRFKTHPKIASMFSNGKRLSYGARALNEGGWQSIPQLAFPGGVIIGDSAGFLNVPKIKGSHTAMKSGMLAAETIARTLFSSDPTALCDYREQVDSSWIKQELYAARNIRPGFKWGMWLGLAHAAVDSYIFRGKAPWTLQHKIDHQQLRPASEYTPIEYPAPDDSLTFDKLSSVHLSNVYHEENQLCHLQLTNPSIAIDINLKQFDSPESRYCPAAVYEIVYNDEKPQLQINAQNCIHCKTCDIKDPKQNINWTCPEGGGGPNYTDM